MNSTITSMLAKRIRDLRALYGYTQEQVADRLQLSRATYNAIENGKRDLTTSELASLAAFYDMSLLQLFGNYHNDAKFQQMYFYILSFFPTGVPKTKLAKLLYLSDFRNYYEELKPISDAHYIRRQYGPLADCFLEITDELYDSGKITIDKLPEGAFLIKSTSFNQDYSLLSPKEKQRIAEICHLWKNKTTKEIVNYTHEQKPWASCRDGEFIPYELIIQEEPTHVYAPLR